MIENDSVPEEIPSSNFIKNSSIILFSNIFISVLNSIIFFIATDYFSDTQFGYLAAGKSLYNIFVVFMDLSFCNIYIQNIAREKENIGSNFTIYLISKLILFPFITLTFYIFIRIRISQDYLSDSPEQLIIIIILFISAIIFSINQIFIFTFQGKENAVKMQVPIIIGQLFRLISCIVALILANFIIYVMGNLFAQIISFLLSSYYLKEKKIAKFNSQDFWDFFKYGIITSPSTIINVLIFNFGPFLFLQHYDEDVLGVYYILANIVLIIQMLENATKSLLIPKISKKLPNTEELLALLNQYEKVMVIISGIISISVGIMGKRLLTLIISPQYLDLAYNYLLISSIYTLSWGIFIPYGLTNFLKKNTFSIYLTELFRLSLCIFSWMVLIPKLNFIAIDLGVWLALIPNSLLNRWILKRKGINTFNLVSLKIMANIGTFLVIISLFITKLELGWGYAIITTILAILLYFIGLVLTNCITTGEIKILTNKIKEIYTKHKMRLVG